MPVEIPPKLGGEFHGISQREKQCDDQRKEAGAEIQVPEPRILVPRRLRGSGGEECIEKNVSWTGTKL